MTAALLILLRIVLALFLVRLVLRALARLLHRREPAAAAAGTQVATVRDRVCNTFLPRERALRALVDGREEHFCSVACRDRALRELEEAR